MRLYHGSNRMHLKRLEPRQADHDRPYLYLSTLELTAAFYLINAVERPFYWFPYGFDADGSIYYQEWYPNAFREAASGKSGCIYTVAPPEEYLSPLPAIPCARLCSVPVPVVDCLEILDCYQWFLDQERAGLFSIRRYESLTPEQLSRLNELLLQELQQRNMAAHTDSLYAKWIRTKFPSVWVSYLELME